MNMERRPRSRVGRPVRLCRFFPEAEEEMPIAVQTNGQRVWSTLTGSCPERGSQFVVVLVTAAGFLIQGASDAFERVS